MKTRLLLLIFMLALAGCVKIGPGKLTAQKRARLVQGYPELYSHMEAFGCPRCHTTGPQLRANIFKLPPPGQDDTLAVRMLWERLDTNNVDQSKLLRKPDGDLGHGGGKILNPLTYQEWKEALIRWYRS